MPIVLPKLREVAWSDVEDAYGPAVSIPGLLEAIAKGEKATKAFDDLVDRIAHQGTITPAALPAAPFLVALARASCEPFGPLLSLLGDLASGGFHGNHALDPLPRSEPGTDFAALIATLVPALPIAEAALSHTKPDTRASAVIVLAVLGGEVERGALSTAASHEANAATLATMLAGLGFLGLRLGPAVTTEADPVSKTPPKAEAPRLAAALLRAQNERTVVAADALLAIAGTAKEKHPGVRWNDGELRELCLRFAASVLAEANALDRVLALEDVLGAEATWSLLLERVFGEPARKEPAPEPKLPADFTPDQRATLDLLAPRYTRLAVARAKKPTAPSPPLDLFQRHGIFAIDRLLGFSKPGPRDAPVTSGAAAGEPLWRLAFRTRRHHDGRHADWKQAIAPLDFEARLALLVDLRELRYGYNYPPKTTRSFAEQARYETAFDVMVREALNGAPSAMIAPVIHGLPRGQHWRVLVACWVDALAAEGTAPPQSADALLRDALGGVDPDPTIARTVLTPLPLDRRDALAGHLDLDILDTERPPVFRAGWHVVDLVPALYRHAVERLAGLAAPRSSWDGDLTSQDEATIAEGVRRLSRAPDLARALVPAVLPRASQAGRDILERLLASV